MSFNENELNSKFDSFLYIIYFKTKYGYENDEVDITPFIIKTSSYEYDEDNIIKTLINSNDAHIMACIFKLVLDHGHSIKHLRGIKHLKEISQLYKILYESETFITGHTIENNIKQYMEYMHTYKKALFRFLFMMSYISDESGSKCTYLFIQRRKIIRV